MKCVCDATVNKKLFNSLFHMWSLNILCYNTKRVYSAIIRIYILKHIMLKSLL